MVLEDVVEYEYTASGRKEVRSFAKQLGSCNYSLISFSKCSYADRIGSNIVKWSEHMHDDSWRLPVISFLLYWHHL